MDILTGMLMAIVAKVTFEFEFLIFLLLVLIAIKNFVH